MLVEAFIVAALTVPLPQQYNIPYKPQPAGGCAGTDFTAYGTLEAHWTLDANTWLDETANNNDLTEITTDVGQEGTIKEEGTNSADFSGATATNARLVLDEADMAAGMPTESSASTTGDLTYAFRLNFADINTGAYVQFFHPSNWNDHGPIIAKDTDDYFTISSQFDNCEWTTAVTASTWYHLGLRYTSADTADELSLVVDDVERCSVNDDAHGVCPASQSGCLNLGTGTEGANEFEGYMDEVLILSASLDLTEFTSLHANGADGCGLP